MNPTATLRTPLARALAILILFGLATARPAAANAAAGNATITFRKIFKSSYPEFVEIKISESGAGTYDIRQLDEDSPPLPMQIDASLTQSIFDLAGKLHNFEGVDLEIHRRIANLGEKTFIYDRGTETHKVTFNYTLDHSAEQLLEVFENLARQETDLADLQRTMRYDRLGVNDVVDQIESDYNKKLLPEPSQLLALLDQVAADEHFIDIARQKARTLAGRIRADH